MKPFAKIGLSLLLVGGAALSVVSADTNPRVDALHVQVLADLDYVQKLQAVARSTGEAIALGCLNEKLVLLKGQANLSDTAANTGDVTQMENVASAARTLRESADGCVASKQLKTERSNSFIAPEDPVDPTGYDGLGQDPWSGVFEPAGYASPIVPNN